MAEARQRSPLQIHPDILKKLALDFMLTLQLGNEDLMICCFAIEKAFYQYVDKILLKSKRKHCRFEDFAAVMIDYLPVLRARISNVPDILEQYRIHQAQKTRCGAILLKADNPYEFLLVEELHKIGGKEAFSYPKGKIDPDETHVKCAIREVLEETGFDITGRLNPNLFLEQTVGKGRYEHTVRLYIITDVPGNFQFQPKVHGEIRKPNWFHYNYINGLKEGARAYDFKSFAAVVPFMERVKSWVDSQRLKKLNNLAIAKQPPKN